MRHAAADDDGIDLVDHILNDANLVRHLRAADNGDERTLRCLERLADVVDLLLHEETRYRLKICRDADVRGVCAVRHTERIIHRNVRE